MLIIKYTIDSKEIPSVNSILMLEMLNILIRFKITAPTVLGIPTWSEIFKGCSISYY